MTIDTAARKALREAAEAAKHIDWWREHELNKDPKGTYLAAVSPQVILSLLDELEAKEASFQKLQLLHDRYVQVTSNESESMQDELDRLRAGVAHTGAPRGERYAYVPIAATEAQWGGLARDIVMAWDMDSKTPRKMFKHLEMSGRDIPQWLRDEPEMKNLDHIPSKGTRAVILYRAMVEAAPKGASNAN